MEHSKVQDWAAARALFEPIRSYFLDAQKLLQAKGLM
jgi:hypothetical protein